MLEIDGKYYAGVEGSIQILKQLVAQHYNTQRVLTALDIHVIGQVDNASQLPVDFTGAFGDAYAVGAEHPYDLYIWTRTDETGTQGYWFNIGPIAILGPQGPQGQRGPQGPAGKNVKIYLVQGADELFNYDAVEGDLGIDADGDLWRYNGRQWLLEFNIKGPQGPQGARGPQGIRGEQGPQGLQGPRGDVGGFIKIIGNLTSIDLLPQPSALGDLTAAYIVGTERNLYIQVGPTSESAIWTNVGPLNVATLVTVGGEYQNIWDADTKVDEWEGVPGGYVTYRGRLVFPDGHTETRLVRAYTTPLENAIAVWNSNRQLSTKNPTGDEHCANKKYVDDLASTKLDKITDVSQAGNFGGAYILKTDGTQGMMKITNTVGSGTLPIRGAGGVIVAGAPTDATHVATKGYVDDLAATKLDKYIGQGGNFRLYGVDSDGVTQKMYNTSTANFNGFVARYGAAAGGTTDAGGYLITADPVNPYHCANKNYVDTTTKLYRHDIYLLGAMGEQCWFTLINKVSTPYTDLSGLPNHAISATGYLDYANPPTQIVAIKGNFFTTNINTQVPLSAVGTLTDNVTEL